MDDIVEEDAQDAYDINILCTSSPHGENESQQKSVTVDEIPNNSTHNVNLLNEEDIKKL